MRPSLPKAALVLTLCSLLVPPSFAQDSASRAGIEQFRDSLAQVSDSTALIALEARMIDSARVARDDALLHIRLGFLALRIAELGSSSRYDDAGSEFEWAADLEPTWPYPWLGLANAEAGLADSLYGFRTRLRAVFGADPMTLAAEAVSKATRVDSTFVPGLTAMIDIVSRQRLNADPDGVLQVIRRAAATEAGQHLDFIFARANLERDMGFADSAAAAYQRYLNQGGDQTRGRFELTRTRLAMGELEAQNEYYSLAGSGDSVVAGGFRRDFSLIAGDSGLAAYDSAGVSGRERFLRRFWTRRDRADMRKEGERLAEHYRRIFYAHRHFRRMPGPMRSNVQHLSGTLAFEDYIPVQSDYDARGEIYVRHGEPTERIEFPNPCNVSWRYARADGDLTFHFMGRGEAGNQNYMLKASILEVCGPEDLAVSQVAHWGRLYQRLINPGPNSVRLFTVDQAVAADEDIKEGTTTDRHELTFARRLPAIAQVLAVGRGEGGSLVHFTYAIRGDSLRPEIDNGVVSYTLRTRILVTSMAGEVITTLDTTRSYVVGRAIPAGEFLAARETITIPPGARIFRMAVQQGDSTGGVFPTGAIQVGRFGYQRDSLAVSDLVLGSRTSSLTWHPTDVDTVYFNPLRSIREGSNLELYYEVYGLRPASEYSTALSIKRQGRNRAEIRLNYTELSGPDVTRVRRTLGIERLREGEYTMEIEIRADGRVVRQERGFRVAKE
jgi:hypothetical protein